MHAPGALKRLSTLSEYYIRRQEDSSLSVYKLRSSWSFNIVWKTRKSRLGKPCQAFRAGGSGKSRAPPHGGEVVLLRIFKTSTKLFNVSGKHRRRHHDSAYSSVFLQPTPDLPYAAMSGSSRWLHNERPMVGQTLT